MKALAALQGKTIKQYALERLLPAQIESGQAWLELKAFLTNRIEQGLNGDLPTKSFDQIVDEELGQGSAS